MNSVTDSAATGFGWGGGTSELDRFVLARTGEGHVGYARRWPEAMWRHAAELAGQFTGPAWEQSLPPTVPLPGWLLQLCNGHMQEDPEPCDPTLFYTSGLSAEWFTAAREHPEVRVRELTRSDAGDTELFLADLGQAAARVDADARVYGDGERYEVVIHCISATFPSRASARRFAVSPGRTWGYPSRRGVTVAFEPRVPVRERQR